MPIDYRIDAQRKIVFVVVEGVLCAEDIVAYRRETCARAEVADCDELVDMSKVRELRYESQEQMRSVIAESARYDCRGGKRPIRVAIFASDDLSFGMARMYGALRETAPGSNKEIEVFRDYDAALSWLERRL